LHQTDTFGMFSSHIKEHVSSAPLKMSSYKGLLIYQDILNNFC
jgi:hypothetical protein